MKNRLITTNNSQFKINNSQLAILNSQLVIHILLKIICMEL